MNFDLKSISGQAIMDGFFGLLGWIAIWSLSVSSAIESASSTSYQLLWVFGIAGCLSGEYFLISFLPSGDSGAKFLLAPTLSPSSNESKSPLPPPPGRTANPRGLRDKSELGKGGKAAVPSPAIRKLPPQPGKK